MKTQSNSLISDTRLCLVPVTLSNQERNLSDINKIYNQYGVKDVSEAQTEKEKGDEDNK